LKFSSQLLPFIFGAILAHPLFIQSPAFARKLFNVYCNPLDPGAADCRTLPEGIKIDCIASSGGLAQCMDPATKQFVNCVPYQIMMPGDAGGSAIQLACYSNVQSGARDSRFDRNRLDDHEFQGDFDDPFAP
jgi:hypothetical protein